MPKTTTGGEMKRIGLAVLAALSIGLAACGGDSPPADSVSTDAVETVAPTTGTSLPAAKAVVSSSRPVTAVTSFLLRFANLRIW